MSDEPELELPSPKAPPPSPALTRALAGLRPVSTRHPWRALGVVAAVSLSWMALWLVLVPRRADLPSLPLLPWLLVALAWLAGFLVPLAFAIVPRRGSVLPDGTRAGRTALAVALGLIALAVLLTPSSPVTRVPTGMHDCMHWASHCLTRGVLFASVPLVLALVALRRVLLVGGARLVACAGVAGGALGGLTLHVICPLGGALHLGCGHAGAVVASAALGAIVGFVVERYGQGTTTSA